MVLICAILAASTSVQRSTAFGVLGGEVTLAELPQLRGGIRTARGEPQALRSQSYVVGLTGPANGAAWVPVIIGIQQEPAHRLQGMKLHPVATGVSQDQINSLLSKLEQDPHADDLTEAERRLLKYLVPVEVPIRNGFGRVQLESDVAGRSFDMMVYARPGPAKPAEPNWYAGDTHLHSSRSDGLLSAFMRVRQARDNGLSWVAMTDHAQMMDTKPWYVALYAHQIGNSNRTGEDDYLDYRQHLQTIETALDFPVLAALEYSTKDPVESDSHKDAHFLVFDPPLRYLNNPSEDWQTTPEPPIYSQLTGQYFVDHFARVCATSIAHPILPKYPWFYRGAMPGWTTEVTGWDDIKTNGSHVGIEIMSYGGSGDFSIDQRLQTIWHRRLLNGDKIYLTAGSDDHFVTRFGRHWTYVYVPPTSRLSKASVGKALREGRTIASTGPFLSLEVDGRKVGDTVIKPAGAMLDVTVVWRAPYAPTRIAIWENGIERTLKLSEGARKQVGADMQVTWKEKYAVPKVQHSFVYASGAGDPRQNAYTSPIYVRPDGT